MLVGADRQSQGAGDQGGARQEVEKAADPQPDQEEFDRIADRALIDVELRDIMVRRVGQPQRIPIMHAAMHPILAEVEDEGDQEGLHQQRQAHEPGEFFPVEHALDRFDHDAVADIAVDHAQDGEAEPDIEQVDDQFLPGQAPAVMARIDPFQRQQQRLEANADADRGRCRRDRIGRIIPEGNESEERCRLKPGEEMPLDRAAFDPGQIFPPDGHRRLSADHSVAYANAFHVHILGTRKRDDVAASRR